MLQVLILIFQMRAVVETLKNLVNLSSVFLVCFFVVVEDGGEETFRK